MVPNANENGNCALDLTFTMAPSIACREQIRNAASTYYHKLVMFLFSWFLDLLDLQK